MPNNSALRSPAAQNLLAAAVAGLGVLARPARIPTWARRGLTVANTAGTAGSLFMTDKAAENSDALGLKPVNTKRDVAVTSGSAIAAAAGSLSLLSSGIGLKLDAKAENYLLKKGVRHPRIWMAVAAVGLVFAIKSFQDAAARTADTAASKLAEKQADKQGSAGQVTAGTAKPAVARSSFVPATTASASSDNKSTVGSADQSTNNGQDRSDKASDEATGTGGSDALRAEASRPAAGSATPEGASDAPGAAPAGDVDDTPIWKNVTDNRGASTDNSDEGSNQAAGDNSDGPSTQHADHGSDAFGTGNNGATDGSDASGHRPSLFEQQLAETTVDDVDEPNPTDLSTEDEKKS